MKNIFSHPGVRGLVLAVLVFVVVSGYLKIADNKALWPYSATPTPMASDQPDTSVTWTNARYGLALTYDAPLRPYAQAQDQDYLPICDGENAMLCVVYPKANYPETNYSGAGLSVTVQDCAGLQWAATGTETINGTTFNTYAIGDAAAGHQSSGILWRHPLESGQCLDMALRVHTTTFENYEPGSIVRFSDADKALVLSTLKAAAHTLTVK